MGWLTNHFSGRFRVNWEPYKPTSMPCISEIRMIPLVEAGAKWRDGVLRCSQLANEQRRRERALDAGVSVNSTRIFGMTRESGTSFGFSLM